MKRAVLVLALVAALPAAASAQRVIAPRAQLRLEGDPHGLVFSFDVGSARRLDSAYEAGGLSLHRERTSIARSTPVSAELCASPCDAEVDAGVYKLRLGVPGRGDASAGEVFLRTGHHRLVGHFASRGDARTVGTVLLLFPGLPGFIASFFVLIASPLGWLAVAGAAAILGTSLGLVMLGDDASVRVDP